MVEDLGLEGDVEVGELVRVLQGNLAVVVGYDLALVVEVEDVGVPFLRETDQSRWIVTGCNHISGSRFRSLCWGGCLVGSVGSVVGADVVCWQSQRLVVQTFACRTRALGAVERTVFVQWWSSWDAGAPHWLSQD